MTVIIIIVIGGRGGRDGRRRSIIMSVREFPVLLLGGRANFATLNYFPPAAGKTFPPRQTIFSLADSPYKEQFVMTHPSPASLLAQDWRPLYMMGV